MKVGFACDHAGLPLREAVTAAIRGRGHDTVDLGVFTAEAVDYPDIAEALGRAVQSGRVDRGVLVCGSGVGAAVAANKMRGVRAGLCHDNYSAHQAVEHDNVNVLALGARVIGPSLAVELVQTFLAASFSGEDRHLRRLAKVAALEEKESRRPPE